MIEIRGLHKYFGQSDVLRGMDPDVEKGEVHDAMRILA